MIVGAVSILSRQQPSLKTFLASDESRNGCPTLTPMRKGAYVISNAIEVQGTRSLCLTRQPLHNDRTKAN